MAKGRWEQLDSRTQALAGASVALLLVAFGLGLAFDNSDSGGSSGSLLESVFFAVKSVVHEGPVVERPTTWSTPSESALTGFVNSFAADPAAPKAFAALSSDRFLVEQWMQFQRTHDSASFVSALQGHRKFQEALAAIAADPEFADIKRRVLSHPVGQALAPRFVAFSVLRPGTSAEAGDPARAAQAGSSDTPAVVTGVVDPAAGELAPPGPGRIDSEYSGPSSRGDIKVPGPTDSAVVDQRGR